MQISDELRRKLASNRFQIDHVYRRKRIVANCEQFTEKDDRAVAIVKAHAEPFVDVAFDFQRVSGAKWKCFGVGRADRIQ